MEDHSLRVAAGLGVVAFQTLTRPYAEVEERIRTLIAMAEINPGNTFTIEVTWLLMTYGKVLPFREFQLDKGRLPLRLRCAVTPRC